MEQYVYVLDKKGRPLMPTKRYGHVRRLLRSNKAVVVNNKPFTIRLKYEPETHVTQDVIVGVDPGRSNIGISAVREDGTCLMSIKCTTRNKKIPKLMEERAAHRHASRRGERLARKRLAKKLGTTMKGLLERKLPGYHDGVVQVKDIINTETRFNNRKRPKGSYSNCQTVIAYSCQSDQKGTEVFACRKGYGGIEQVCVHAVG